MYKSFLKLFFPFILLFAVQAQAQNHYDVAWTSYCYTPTHYEGSSSEKLVFHTNRTEFNFPLASQNSLRPYLGGRYRYTFLSSDVMQLNTQNRLTNIQLRLGGIYEFSESSKLTCIFSPSIGSDMEDFSAKDFQFAGELFMKQNINNRWNLSYGVEYRRTPFGNYVQLLLGANGNINDKIQFDIQWPYSAKLNYSATRDINVGIEYAYELDSFRFAEFLGNDYLRSDERKANAFAELFLMDELVAFAKAGWLIQLDYNVFNDSDTYTEIILPKTEKEKIAEPYHKGFAKGVTFEIGIAYRIRLNKEAEK